MINVGDANVTICLSMNTGEIGLRNLDTLECLSMFYLNTLHEIVKDGFSFFRFFYSLNSMF